MAADREHHLIGGDARAVRQMRGENIAVAVHAIDRAGGQKRDARLLHLAANVLAHILVEAAQDVVATIDQRDV